LSRFLFFVKTLINTEYFQKQRIDISGLNFLTLFPALDWKSFLFFLLH
jgi:hypothetical protein